MAKSAAHINQFVSRLQELERDPIFDLSRGKLKTLTEQISNTMVHCSDAVTQVRVDLMDPGFATPTKPIGPCYDQETGSNLATTRGWTMVPDGDHLRRAVPSPIPKEIIELAAIRLLVDAGVTVIAAGGGGIPVVQDAMGGLGGVEAVVDKDLTAVLLACELDADHLLLLTDVEAVLTNWDQAERQSIRRATPQQLTKFVFDTGSMGPKIDAACSFVSNTGGVASIGALTDAAAILQGRAGTTIHNNREPLEFAV